MDDTMTGHLDFCGRRDGTRFLVVHGEQQMPDDLATRRNPHCFLEGNSLWVLHNQRCAIAFPFDRALP
jgi:hypothetical protein